MQDPRWRLTIRPRDHHQARLRIQIQDCDRRLKRYRAILDADGDVATVAQWITKVEREPRSLVAQLRQRTPGTKLTKDEVTSLVLTLQDTLEILANADPADKAQLYQKLGISLIYRPDGPAKVTAMPRGLTVRVGGGT